MFPPPPFSPFLLNETRSRVHSRRRLGRDSVSTRSWRSTRVVLGPGWFDRVDYESTPSRSKVREMSNRVSNSSRHPPIKIWLGRVISDSIDSLNLGVNSLAHLTLSLALYLIHNCLFSFMHLFLFWIYILFASLYIYPKLEGCQERRNVGFRT